MGKVEKLIDLAKSKGLEILSFEFFLDSNWIRVVYHQSSKAGKPPIKEHCRDVADYKLLMSAWIKAGTVYSPNYTHFDTMISEELKRLKYGR